jgi:DNA-binding transcriptional LysR family regulator
MKLPPANALIAFEAAARHLSISRAGDELGVTHAAVSHHIRHLEQWFGLELFCRQGRSIRLTESGEILAETMSRSLRDIESCCRGLRQSGGQSLTIASIPSIASRWLIPLLPAFQTVHPEIDLRVIYARASDRFETINADILITLLPMEAAGPRARRLFSRKNMPVASPHYLARKSKLSGPPEIAAADLLHDETTAPWRDWFEKASPGLRPLLRGPIFQDFNLLATALIAGHGVALCPVEVFAREIASGDLVLLSEIATLEHQAYLMQMPDRPSGLIRQFADWFCDQLPVASAG